MPDSTSFSSKEAGKPCGFKSTWKKNREKHSAEESTQTIEILTDDIHTQSFERASKEVQVSGGGPVLTTLASKSISDQEAPEQLSRFLGRVAPLVEEQLFVNSTSNAFSGYEVLWDDDCEDLQCLHSLTHATLSDCMPLQISSLSWNAMGSVIAVGYGKFNHQDWCPHKGYLCTWNIERRRVNEVKADVELEVSSCVMSLSFHPKEPSLLTVGTFNGDVLLYNLSRASEDPLVAQSEVSEHSHREPVLGIRWVDCADVGSGSGTSKVGSIVSTGGDGKVLLWSVVFEKRRLSLLNGFILLTSSVPKNLRVSKARGDAEMGATCISFSYENENHFFIGTENGGVFKCSLAVRGSHSSDALADLSKSPIIFSYMPHQGPVYSVNASPFHRNLFLTCGTDGCVRVYNALHVDPILVIDSNAGYLFDSKWSSLRPCVFATCSSNGKLIFYDLSCSRNRPYIEVYASGTDKSFSETKVPDKPHTLYVVEPNRGIRRLWATGDSSGVVKIFKTGRYLSSLQQNENAILGNILNG
eukprot:Nk52_evm63s152 gene=Nk52_evmTU63s152